MSEEVNRDGELIVGAAVAEASSATLPREVCSTRLKSVAFIQLFSLIVASSLYGFPSLVLISSDTNAVRLRSQCLYSASFLDVKVWICRTFLYINTWIPLPIQ